MTNLNKKLRKNYFERLNSMKTNLTEATTKDKAYDFIHEVEKRVKWFGLNRSTARKLGLEKEYDKITSKDALDAMWKLADKLKN